MAKSHTHVYVDLCVDSQLKYVAQFEDLTLGYMVTKQYRASQS